MAQMSKGPAWKQYHKGTNPIEELSRIEVWLDNLEAERISRKIIKELTNNDPAKVQSWQDQQNTQKKS